MRILVTAPKHTRSLCAETKTLHIDRVEPGHGFCVPFNHAIFAIRLVWLLIAIIIVHLNGTARVCVCVPLYHFLHRAGARRFVRMFIYYHF